MTTTAASLLALVERPARWAPASARPRLSIELLGADGLVATTVGARLRAWATGVPVGAEAGASADAESNTSSVSSASSESSASSRSVHVVVDFGGRSSGRLASVEDAARKVVVAVDPSADEVRAAIADGARAIVTMSDEPSELTTAVAAAATGQVYLSPSVVEVLAGAPAARPPALGDREREAASLLIRGLAIKSVAYAMNVRLETAKTYLKRIRAKYAERGDEFANRMQFLARLEADLRRTGS